MIFRGKGSTSTRRRADHRTQENLLDHESHRVETQDSSNRKLSGAAVVGECRVCVGCCISQRLQRRAGFIASLCFSLVFISPFLHHYHLVPAPEVMLQHTFLDPVSVRTSADFANDRTRDYQARALSKATSSLLPSQCHDTARQFLACQEQQERRALVFTCHRKWCHDPMGGHCDSCTGIGDRFYRNLMHSLQSLWDTRSLVANNTQGSCPPFRFQLEYPVSGMSVLRSVVYQDPASWIGELLHFRSYSVPQRRDVPMNLSSLFSVVKSGRNDGSTRRSRAQVVATNGDAVVYAHFLSLLPPGLSQLASEGKNHGGNDVDRFQWDPCLFHTIFQPDESLRREIRRHQRAILGLDQPGAVSSVPGSAPQLSSYLVRRVAAASGTGKRVVTVGIHFRTGDGASFRGVIPNDVRIRGSLLDNWSNMLQCAQELGQELVRRRRMESSQRDTAAGSSSNEPLTGVRNDFQIRYYLATDNIQIKNMIRQSRKRQSDYRDVYITDIVPTDHKQGIDSDRNAWLEIYLLSIQDGIAANVRTEQNYTSTAAKLSTFSRFAHRIGFHDSATQFKQCKLE
jgi:hypothetical protein